MRPGQPWGDVVRVLNHGQQASWTFKQFHRNVQRLAREGIIEAGLMGRARRQGGGNRLVRLVASIKTAAPNRTLNQIATQRKAMRERMPRGGTRWHPSSVRHLLRQA